MCLFRVSLLDYCTRIKESERKIICSCVFFGCGQPPLKDDIRILVIRLELAWKGGLWVGISLKRVKYHTHLK